MLGVKEIDDLVPFRLHLACFSLGLLVATLNCTVAGQ